MTNFIMENIKIREKKRKKEKRKKRKFGAWA